MYRIRFHGRGGQGIKTASRILGTAFFLEGYEVQDAPRYGAERRGAPIFAYVRASIAPVFERGVIRDPDLVVVADESLVQVAASGVLQGLSGETTLLIASDVPADEWRTRLEHAGHILALGRESWEGDADAFMGATCAGAAARLVGVISRGRLEEAIRAELEDAPTEVVSRNLERALGAFDEMAPNEGSVTPADAALPINELPRPLWVELASEPTSKSVAVIRGGPTSEQVKTGLWRTHRPVVEYDHCRHCTWICGTLCPEGAIGVGSEGEPVIDLEHCKGCLLCASVCPSHAIAVELESTALSTAKAGKASPKGGAT